MIDLRFNKVSKRYRVRNDDPEETPSNSLIRKLRSLRGPMQDFWALRDVSFEVTRGECLGIIGHNGAGKSTILKLLANITAPTKGEIEINGRLSALIEVGSGFHPELTGRENIYLNGSILGMTRREIAEKLNSIVEFAGIKQFVDTPVKRFSSGMYVRLGFSIAAHLDPDILLLDEVLAVGDAAFQARCLQRIDELRNNGTTIVFISHDLGAVERVCERVLLLSGGRIVKNGLPSEVISAYERNQYDSTQPRGSIGIDGNGAAKIRRVSFENMNGENQSVFNTGDRLLARIEFDVHQAVSEVIFDIAFYSPAGVVHCELTTEADGKYPTAHKGPGMVEFVCDPICLMPGIYHTDVRIRSKNTVEAIHALFHTATLRIEEGKRVRGNFYMPHEWHLTQSEIVEQADLHTL